MSTELISQLHPIIESALNQTEPHCGRGTGSGLIFTGNYDYHSSVHAHWALLSMARLSDDEALQTRMLKRLSPANLAAEHQFLADGVEFELPYGRAWLALLLSELERHPHGYDALPQLRALIENQVASWLEQTRFGDEADATEAENVACGSHQSWLFAFWLLQLSAPTAGVQSRLDALRPRIERERERLNAAQPTPYDFLYLPAVLYAVDRTDLASNVAFYAGDCALQLETIERANCHTAGANVARLWPLAFNKSGEFERAIAPILNDTTQWRDDFLHVAHWVPQFIWLGAMLERGEFAARREPNQTRPALKV